jgi:hypothetical protein
MLQEINYSSSETCTCNSIAEVPTTGKIGSADVLKSSGNPAEDNFITAIKKKGGDIEAEKSSENTKTTIKFRTHMHAVCNSSSLALLSKSAKTKALYVSCFSHEVSAREVENSAICKQSLLRFFLRNFKRNLIHMSPLIFLSTKMTVHSLTVQMYCLTGFNRTNVRMS